MTTPKISPMIWILILFGCPLLIVWGLYFFGWRSPVSTSHGQLVRPPHQLAIPVLVAINQSAFTTVHWHDKWNIVYIAPEGCQVQCQDDLYWIKQVHTSLNKGIERVQRILLLPASVEMTPAFLQHLQTRQPDLIVLRDTSNRTLMHQFEATLPSGHVYLVDPLGFLMMTYKTPLNAQDLRKDMNHLLRYSWAG